jgi:hypothetical protein
MPVPNTLAYITELFKAVKMFIVQGPMLYNFFGHNSQMFIIMQSVCPWQVSQA